MFAMKTDHVRFFAGDLESELFNVKGCRFLRILRLNQNVRTKAVCHIAPSCQRGSLSANDFNLASAMSHSLETISRYSFISITGCGSN